MKSETELVELIQSDDSDNYISHKYDVTVPADVVVMSNWHKAYLDMRTGHLLVPKAAFNSFLVRKNYIQEIRNTNEEQFRAMYMNEWVPPDEVSKLR
jgi:hypothetical protein